MALTRTIPIKNRVFSVCALNTLLKDLSAYYRKPKDSYSRNRYHLNISEDETTTISLDAPPKNFENLLSSPICYISLRIDSSSPDRQIEFTLYHGSDSIHNSIRLHSGDDNWVNLAYGKVYKILDSVEPQSKFLRRHSIWLTLMLAFTIGWPLKSLFILILSLAGQVKMVPWSITAFMQLLMLAGSFGILPAMMLMSYAANAYPSVEIQTGPSRKWREASRRKRLRIIFALAVVAPSADFLYDIYQKLFTA